MAEDQAENSPAPLPASKAELMARIDTEWRALQETIAALSETQAAAMGPGGWSIKDHLAHISEWEGYLLRSVLRGEPVAQAMGIDAQTLQAGDVDALNAIFQRRNKDRPLAHVLTGFLRSHAEVVSALERIPFPDLLKPSRPEEPQPGPVIELVLGNTSDHYREHRLYIERLAAGAGQAGI